MKKITLEDAIKKISEINKDLEVISEEYINSRTPLKLRCTICGNIIEKPLKDIYKNFTCSKCRNKDGKFQRLSIEEIQEKAKIKSPGITILSDKYIHAKNPLKCQCEKCGHIWDVKMRILRDGTKCPNCNKDKPKKQRKDRVNSGKLTKEIVKQRLSHISDDIIVNYNDFEKSSSKMRCKCKVCGTEWRSSVYTLEANHGCPKCAKIKSAESCRYTMDYVKARLAELTDNTIIVSDTYINSSTDLLCQCNTCGNLWTTNWSILRQRQQCPECAKENVRGKNSPAWDGGVTELNAFLRGAIYDWKRDSMVYSGYRCVITGEKFDEVHHIYGFNTIVKDVLHRCELPIYEKIGMYSEEELESLRKACVDIHYENGLGACLTEKVHEKFHSIYGYGDNTLEQFEEFKQNYAND